MLDPNGTPAITYSIPLLTEDGVPYGVFGVEMTTEYMTKKLPYTEINGNIQGSYVLAKKDRGVSEFNKLISTGPYFKNIFGSECKSFALSDVPVEGQSYEIIQDNTDKSYGCVQYLNLYNSNTPFENEQWALIGVIKDDNLLGLYHSVLIFLVLALLVAFSIGIASIIFNSIRLARPITQLAKKVRNSNPSRPVLLGKIDVAEIDELSASIEVLSQSVADSYSTLSKIMAMAGYSVGAYEYSAASNEIRYTDVFFDVLGLPTPTDGQGILSVSDFTNRMKPLESYPREYIGSNTIYQITKDGNISWIKMQSVKSDEKTLGVVSDVTADILQRKRLEYERDFDSLTMLQNRRAFHEKVGNLLNSGDVHIAAMIMIDLDNLKYINDTYGHDIGDNYLRTAAMVLHDNTADNVFTARMSGDEFYIFINGDNRGEIEKIIENIKYDLGTAKMDLPDGTKTRVRVSAGIAWYPKDSDSFLQLIRYADFAMYRVKHTTKGRFSEFNQDNYDRESFLLNNKEELNHLIDDGLIHYDFQAIVDAHDGSVFGYEALMRPTSPLFASPLDILAVAHSQSKLYEIERLTMFKALEAFSDRSSSVGKEKLFLNSIPNQMLGSTDLTVLENAYGNYLSRIVVELTEEEKPDGHLIHAKNAIIKDWKAQIALDDFGSGYNGESALLAVSPDYIKIDQSIVRGLDSDGNRRKIIENIMEYANKYHIMVIGEGVETKEEMRVLISYGVQYLQGFYLSYPNSELQQVSENIRNEIRDFYNKK